MSWGTVKVGRLTLTESQAPGSEQTSRGERTIRLVGQESKPPLRLAELLQRHADLVALPDGLLPVTFTEKAAMDGFYRVGDRSSELVNNMGIAVANWSLTLQRVGSEHELDLESRLSGAQSRVNDFTVTGERILTPPIGHYGFDAGTTAPTVLTRAGEDGALTVYRGIPVNVHPRWAASPTAFLAGRVRFVDDEGLERSGVNVPLAPAGWSLTNGLVRVRPAAGLLEVAAWSGGAWQPKTWDVRVSGVSLGAPVSVTLLRNDPELVVARVMWLLSGPGRVTADLTVRRGSRFVEVWIEGQTSATIRVQRGEVEAGTAASGYVRATVNDAAGNRYVIGSARTASTDVTNGALFKAATTTLGLFIGAAVGGSAAVSGDTPTDLFAQYIGVPSERVEGVRR